MYSVWTKLVLLLYVGIIKGSKMFKEIWNNTKQGGFSMIYLLLLTKTIKNKVTFRCVLI